MTTTAISEQQLIEMGQAAQAASRNLSRQSTQARNRALINIAEALEGDQSAVLEANGRD